MERLKAVILIVEDEFLLRMDSAEMIEDAGVVGQNRIVPHKW